MSINNAYNLIQDIDNAFYNWNEKSQFNLGGVGNLSVADLEEIKMYAESYINSGGYDFGGMKPFGYTKDVLDKYGINVSYSW